MAARAEAIEQGQIDHELKVDVTPATAPSLEIVLPLPPEPQSPAEAIPQPPTVVNTLSSKGEVRRGPEPYLTPNLRVPSIGPALGGFDG